MIASKATRYARAEANRQAAAKGTLNMDIHTAVSGYDRHLRMSILHNVLGSVRGDQEQTDISVFQTGRVNGTAFHFE